MINLIRSILLLVTVAALSTTLAAKPPNVILVLTDDQAYGDAGFTGNPWIKTPFIDSLAEQGTVFTDFYVNPRCAASRAALMTGRYPERSGVFHVTAGAHIMGTDEVTIAEMFRDAGYATGMVGKWHIGDHYPYMPNDQGFDHSLIHGGGAVGQLSDHPDNYWDMTAPLAERKMCYFDPTLFRNREPVKTHGFITDIFTDEAIGFIKEQNAQQPFFLYFATNAPHDPFQVPDEYLELYNDLPEEVAPSRTNGTPSKLSDYDQARYVYALMTNLDDNLRRLADHLKKTGQWDNTIWVFLSDNGPAGYRFNGDLRGKKGTVYDGGIRSPAFIYAPGQKGGQRIDQPAAHIDILPTLASMAKVPLPDKHPLDGVDLTKAMKGKPLPQRALFSRESTWMTLYRDAMARQGPWKLVTRIEGTEPVFELYNLEDDPSETTDVAAKFPEKANALKQQMQDWYRDIRQSPNCRIHPVHIGSSIENPVRLTRHEQVDSYSRGWFSTEYHGYFPLNVVSTGTYSVRLTFKEPLPTPGVIEYIIGPEGNRIKVSDTNLTEFTIEDIFLSEGTAELQAWFKNNETAVSPFFIEIERQ